ncbi:hypothetical protein Bbelb_111450 [Branchiostoma belcheri]|nr:hypothetical protein Bbelb_111450 [Branchiostoma belcheri]
MCPSGISLATNHFWTAPDQDFTRSRDTLAAAWPSLRHGDYYWKVLSADSIECWSYHRHGNEINYHSFRCDEPETLRCGQTKNEFGEITSLPKAVCGVEFVLVGTRDSPVSLINVTCIGRRDSVPPVEIQSEETPSMRQTYHCLPVLDTGIGNPNKYIAVGDTGHAKYRHLEDELTYLEQPDTEKGRGRPKTRLGYQKRTRFKTSWMQMTTTYVVAKGVHATLAYGQGRNSLGVTHLKPRLPASVSGH